MILLSVLYMLVVPMCMGMFVKKIVDYKGQNLADDYLCGVLALFVVSGLIQFATIFMNFTFTWYCRTMLITTIFMGLVGLILSIALQTFSISEFKRGVREKSRAISKSNNILSIFIIAGILLAIFIRIYYSAPVLENDFTMETILTTLSSNAIYKYNSLTGELIQNGMPIRQKILTLPFFLAFMIKTFGYDTGLFVYRIFPCYIAFLSFLVFQRLSVFMFPDSLEKRMTFLHVFGFMTLVGDFGTKAPAYLLIFQGFTGYSVLVNVLLPYLFTSTLRKKWGIAALCAIAEIFLVWTTYGIGFSIITIAFSIVCLATSSIWLKTSIVKTTKQDNSDKG